MALFEFKLPDLGEGVHEGQVVSVMIKEGQRVEAYETIFEIETDKAAVPITSPKTGVIAKLNIQPGQLVKVGQVMIVIDEAGPPYPCCPYPPSIPAAQCGCPLRRAPGRPLR